MSLIGRRDYRRARRFAKSAFHRQRGLCHWCQAPMVLEGDANDPRLMTADHVIEIWAGGLTRADNIVAACRDCNNRRSSAATNRSKRTGRFVLTVGDDTPVSPFAVLQGLVL